MVKHGVPIDVKLCQALINAKSNQAMCHDPGLASFCDHAGCRVRSWCLGPTGAIGRRLRWRKCKGQTVMKLAWALSTHNINFERVVNLDESALLLCPSPSRTWTFRGSQAATGNFISSKQQCTMTIAISAFMDFPVQAQIVFAGKSARSLPRDDPPDGVSLAFTENHWASTETLRSFIAQIQQALFAVYGEGPWVLLMDGAPIHTSAESRDMYSLDFPLMQVLFLEAGSTMVTQPLDLAYFRSLKAKLRKGWGELVADAYWQSTDALGKLSKLPQMKVNVVNLLKRALLECDHQDRRDSAWKHLFIEEAELADLAAQAHALHAAGLLFDRAATQLPQQQQEETNHDEPPHSEDDVEQMSQDEFEDPEDEQDVAPPAPDAPEPSAEEAAQSAACSGSRLGRFLALRLVYGQPTPAELRAAKAIL